MNDPLVDRLVRAIKGTSPIADVKVRINVQMASIRDFQRRNIQGIIQAAASGSPGNGPNSITDPTGNEYAMLDIQGFADGATLKY